jgi:hypothetical protein
MTDTPYSRESLLLFVDFKWLMRGIGWCVDVGRLREDAAYAQGCILRALASNRPLLQACARQVARRTGATVPG